MIMIFSHIESDKIKKATSLRVHYVCIRFHSEYFKDRGNGRGDYKSILKHVDKSEDRLGIRSPKKKKKKRCISIYNSM